MTAVAQARVGRGTTVAAAGAAGTPWLWVLAPGVAAAPGALERLLAVAAEPEAPALVAALVVDAGGRPVRRFAPTGAQADLDAMIAAAPRRRLPLRRCPGGCVLVRRSAVETHGVPHESLGTFAFAEWSARALRDAPGWLVPEARALAEAPASGTWRDVPDALRAARRGGWSAGDTLRALGQALR